MRALSLILAASFALLAPVAGAERLTLLSGPQARPLPVIWDEEFSAIRLRFVVEGLEAASDLEEMERAFEDMARICEMQLAAYRAGEGDPRAEGWDSIVVTLMDRDVTFGMVETGAVQIFEWFRIADTGCMADWDDHAD